MFGGFLIVSARELLESNESGRTAEECRNGGIHCFCVFLYSSVRAFLIDLPFSACCVRCGYAPLRKRAHAAVTLS